MEVRKGDEVSSNTGDNSPSKNFVCFTNSKMCHKKLILFQKPFHPCLQIIISRSLCIFRCELRIRRCIVMEDIEVGLRMIGIRNTKPMKTSPCAAKKNETPDSTKVNNGYIDVFNEFCYSIIVFYHKFLKIYVLTFQEISSIANVWNSFLNWKSRKWQNDDNFTLRIMKEIITCI